MLLVDVDVLVDAVHRRSPRHAAAVAWLESALRGSPQTVALPWACILGFVRMAASRRLFADPVPVPQAWEQVERWLDARAAWVPVPGPRHRQLMAQLVRAAPPVSGGVRNLHLAALAMENGLTVASTDASFGRLPGVHWLNPLR